MDANSKYSPISRIRRLFFLRDATSHVKKFGKPPSSHCQGIVSYRDFRFLYPRSFTLLCTEKDSISVHMAIIIIIIVVELIGVIKTVRRNG